GSIPRATVYLSRLVGEVAGGRPQHRFYLERRQAGVFAQDAGHEPRDVGSGEAVAGDGAHLALQPGDADVDPGRAELDRRSRVVVELVRVVALVAGNGDNGGVQRRVAGDGHVVRGGHQDDALEVGVV